VPLTEQHWASCSVPSFGPHWEREELGAESGLLGAALGEELGQNWRDTRTGAGRRRGEELGSKPERRCDTDQHHSEARPVHSARPELGAALGKDSEC
jgi:hypothetical protein